MNNITNIWYINLEYRTDRKKHIEEQLQKVGLSHAQRFNAVKLANGNGALGCSMSHLKCLENAKKTNQSHILIMEDDIEFLNPTLFIQQCNAFFYRHPTDWDVVLFSGNNMLPYYPIDETCVQVWNCQTTTGYLVHESYFDKMIENIKNGINKLIREPDQKNLYAIDKYWLRLQQKDRWYLIIPLTVVQREDYSDIENKFTNFKNYMTNINKTIKN